MHEFFEKLEHYNSKLINPALVILLIIIIIEIFFHVENETFILTLEIIDMLVIAIFVIDLIFIARKVKSVKFFFKHYWLDLIAIFPFVLLARFIRLFATTEFGISQAILHESVEATKIASESERFAKLGRTIRIGARSLRIISKSDLNKRFERKNVNYLRIKKYLS